MNAITKRTLSGAANEMILSERIRISAILESTEGVTRPRAARELALRSDMQAEQAVALLATMTPDNPFLSAMNAEGQVGIVAQSPGANGSALSDPKAARIAEIAGSIQHFNATRGYAKKAE
jgi:hypothetical protein